MSSSGLVTAAGNGTATVTASVAGRSATVSIQVSQVAQSISLSSDSLLFTAIGDTLRLVAEVSDARSNLIADAAVTWVSSDTTAVSVSQSGLVTAVSNGPSQITASVADLSSEVAVIVDAGRVWIETVGEGTALVTQPGLVRRSSSAGRQQHGNRASRGGARRTLFTSPS